MDVLAPIEHRSACCSPSRVALGLFILFMGMALLGDRQEWTGFRVNISLWPWVLVLIGLAKLGDWRASGQPHPSRAAIALLLFGVWGLVNEYRVFGVSYGRTWPVALAALGIFLVLRSLEPLPNGPSTDER